MSSETLSSRLARLERELKNTLLARRRYFMMAYSGCELASMQAKTLPREAAVERNAAMIDEALDRFAETEQRIVALRSEIFDVRRMQNVQNVTDSLGVKL